LLLIDNCLEVVGFYSSNKRGRCKITLWGLW